jgi:hypothetical protein
MFKALATFVAELNPETPARLRKWHNATGMPVAGAIGVREGHGQSDGGMPRATAETATPRASGVASSSDLGATMTSRAERDEQPDKRSTRTEDRMREAPPPSVLGDVEDAVTPEADGELTPWSPPGQDEEEEDA